jgi:hypothetical protein
VAPVLKRLIFTPHLKLLEAGRLESQEAEDDFFASRHPGILANGYL